ncbi:hypothetical protein IP92_05081 [Pseudoduganella flava]|uniref:Uncharacterized protein n=1 Tax=Pseudoduganella flava TaxID=871742 RepID=A0A562PHP2_9BURK|nr:hypothetical protein [Pseudoduganella flava]QGZ40326.1 hypothetical protein GO485_15545 [Pseudoduganella flava]TWI43516.1 hypothetical protein IP92_05081 [Pseudoduganella flava]
MDDKLNSIVQSLVQGTEAKKLNWQSTARKNELMLNLGHGSITVDSWEFEGEHGESMSLADISFLNNTGEIIERSVFSLAEDRQDYKQLMVLHNLARRNALKIDETLEGMLTEIQHMINT